MSSHVPLPADLPVPVDDGAASHLLHAQIPADLSLPSTSSKPVAIASQPGLTILFCYPRTAPPTETVPAAWNAIPGARGCTPQVCSFRDAIAPLRQAGVDAVYGLSTQSTEFQREVQQRTHLPYDLLSDDKLDAVRALRLPTFEFEGMTLVKRVTLAIRDGKVEKVWYPVFPPDKGAEAVLEWLKG